MSLDGKVAIITGAGGGFGRAFCSSILKAGANVLALDVNTKNLSIIEAENHKFGKSRLLTQTVDIADFLACEAAIEIALNYFGQIDILINNAGLGMGFVRQDHHIELVRIDEITSEIWNRMIGVNLTGPWNMTKCCINNLRQSESARIINVTTSFFTMLRGKFQPYGPSKAGFEAMSASHAAEFSADGITVNVVVPGGPADTAMVPEGAGWNREQLVKPIAMTYPTLWLCSEEAKSITGNRYIAGRWDPEESIERNRTNTETPIAWPNLAQDPVWPGGKPS
jgi:NAD(P)-dependent dehydrogenase (short-subunit alcohol dehydrogenase family)